MEISADTRRLLARTSTATLATQLFKRGLRNTFLLGCPGSTMTRAR